MLYHFSLQNSTQRLHESLRQLPGLAEENVVIFDGFADNLAKKKNDSLIHYLLSNPAYDLIVQISTGRRRGTIR